MRSAVQFILFTLACLGCSSYKQNVMFKVPGTLSQPAVSDKQEDYKIEINDQLEIKVYPNKGERIIDPLSIPGDSRATNNTTVEKQFFTVSDSGFAKFPMIRSVKVAGLTLREAEAMLEKEYGIFYKDAFVLLNYSNKRAVVLGAPGGQVIPLTNENMRLTEVLALAKGIPSDGKSHNIRVMRGKDVIVVDFSTIEGYRKGDILIEPNDIVYVEPIRKPFREAVRDYGPVLSIATSLTTIIVIILGINAN